MPRKEFDNLIAGACAAWIGLARASKLELQTMQPRIGESLGMPIATHETTERIRVRHPDNIWAIHSRRPQRLIGLYAMVMLNAEGLRAVLGGSFDQREPDPAQTAGPEEPVAAIYQWTIFAPGRAVAAVPLMAEYLRRPAYARADLFGTGASAAGRRLMERIGFEPMPDQQGTRKLVVYRYVRHANRRTA